MLQAETATCCSDDPIPQSDSVEQGSLAHGSQERSWKAHHMPRHDFDLGRSDVEWNNPCGPCFTETVSHGSTMPQLDRSLREYSLLSLPFTH